MISAAVPIPAPVRAALSKHALPAAVESLGATSRDATCRQPRARPRGSPRVKGLRPIAGETGAIRGIRRIPKLCARRKTRTRRRIAPILEPRRGREARRRVEPRAVIRKAPARTREVASRRRIMRRGVVWRGGKRPLDCARARLGRLNQSKPRRDRDTESPYPFHSLRPPARAEFYQSAPLSGRKISGRPKRQTRGAAPF